jgi:hypothetical protein
LVVQILFVRRGSEIGCFVRVLGKIKPANLD